MKHRFLKTIALSLPLSLVLILGIKWVTLGKMRNQLDMSLPQGTRVLVLGNSHGRDAICDSLLPGWANRCSDGEIYFGINQLAERMIENNKIDTLVIPMMDFITYRDNRLTAEYLLYESSRIALADSELVGELARLNWRELLTFTLSNEIQTMLKPVEVGGYEHWDHHGLGAELKALDNKLAKEGRVSAPKNSIDDFSLQTHYLSRIMKLCREHNVQLVMMNYPKYKREKYFERSRVWDYFGSLGDSLLIADYEHFELPDTSYYANCTHLNYRGAEHFSRHLREHGLKLLTPAQWRKTRND